ncbi:MAG TPA: cytochrome c [Allosphingosinicella sp.]|nr:cytochrome c [Allosphingosinicella sp.]
MRRLSLLLLPVVAACATASDGAPASAPRAAAPSAAELIAARHAMMHMAATLMFESVMPAVRNGTDVKRQEHAADGLDHFGHSIAGLFPEGSGGPGSRALPTVWTDKAGFQAKANAFGDASARLAELARAGDTAGFAAQAKVVASGCNGCHSLYRVEDKKP